AVLTRGGGWIDTVLFAHAWRATQWDDSSEQEHRAQQEGHPEQQAHPRQQGHPEQQGHLRQQPSPHHDSPSPLEHLTQLAAAFRGSAETALESRQQGTAFLDVTCKAWPHPTLEVLAKQSAITDTPVTHCIAVAVACAAHEIPLRPALHAYVHAVAANLVSAGARLIPLGQTQAQIAIARLSTTITGIVDRALIT